MPMIGRGHLTQAEVEIDRLAMDIKKRNPKINITQELDRVWKYKTELGMAKDHMDSDYILV